MLKNILNLNGAQSLNKKEQKEIKGGMITVGGGCGPNHYASLVLCEGECGTLGYCTQDYDNPNCFKCNYDFK